MTNETPAKVFTLLGASLVSLAFLFVVTATDASFTGTKVAFPDPFSPEKVIAVLDNVSNSYSNFVMENLVAPARVDYAVAADNLSWIASNAGDGALALLNIQDTSQTQATPESLQGRVAGAHTEEPYHVELPPAIGLFSLLGIN